MGPHSNSSCRTACGTSCSTKRACGLDQTHIKRLLVHKVSFHTLCRKRGVVGPSILHSAHPVQISTGFPAASVTRRGLGMYRPVSCTAAPLRRAWPGAVECCRMQSTLSSDCQGRCRPLQCESSLASRRTWGAPECGGAFAALAPTRSAWRRRRSPTFICSSNQKI